MIKRKLSYSLIGYEHIFLNMSEVKWLYSLNEEEYIKFCKSNNKDRQLMIQLGKGG